MTVESASYISQLDFSLPAAGDQKSEGDDHIRTIKTVLKTQFPNFSTTAIAATAAEVNYLSGVTSAIQTQINSKAALASPALTGVPTAPTAAPGTNTTQLATTAFVAAVLPVDSATVAAASKTTPVDADLFPLVDSAASNALKNLSWANLNVGVQSRLQFLQSGTGAVSRGNQAKLQDVVSIKDFGAVGNGVADDTAAIQAALNSGHFSVFVPQGTYNFTSLTLPSTRGFTFSGTGTGSKLIQKGTGIRWPTLASNCLDAHQLVKDLWIDGTSGTSHSLDTSFVQTLDLTNLFFWNVPVGFASLRINGNPTSSTYSHDLRVRGLRIYHNSGAGNGSAGVQLGPHSADLLVNDFIMQGLFLVDYCVLAEAGAQTASFSDCHIYNAKINVVQTRLGAAWYSFTNCVFDNCLSDVVKLIGSTNFRFSNCWVEAINASTSGITLDNASNNTFTTTGFSSFGGSVSCAREINGSSGNKFLAGNIDSVANYSIPLDLTGTGSVYSAFIGVRDYATMYFNGVAQSAQLQNTSTNYGANGSGALTSTAWAIPAQGLITAFSVYVDITPAAGQTFTFNLQKNGSTLGTVVIPSGSFAATLTLSTPDSAAAGNQLSIQSVFSATSGSASPRYSIAFKY